MAAFRTLLVAVMLVATALIAVLGFRTTPVFAAGKENVTSIDVPATETVLVSTRTGPENQEVTQADYDKLHDQYNVTPNGTPTITSKTLDTENVETDTGHSKKSYTKETTTWVISDTAPQPAKTATEPASQENPARDNVDLAPLLLVPVTTAIVAPLAAVPAAVATAIPAAIVGGIANAVPAAVVGGALAAVPAALVGGALNALPAAVAGSALTALPAAVAGSALTALPAAVAGSALTVLPAALTGAALATVPAQLKGFNDGFKLGDVLGTLKTVLPAALLGAALNTVPAALVGAALAVPFAAVNAAIPAFIAGTLLGNLVAFPAGVIAGAIHALAKALPLIPLAFVAGGVIPTGFTLLTLGALNKALKAIPVILAKAVLPFIVVPVVGTIALLAGLNGLKDFVVIPALVVFGIIIPGVIRLVVLPQVLNGALLLEKVAFDQLVRNPLIAALILDALKDAALADLLVDALKAKTAFDLFVRNPLILKTLKTQAKKLAVKAFKDGFKLATLLNKKALADAAVKTLLGLKALNDFVIKPLLGLKALNDFIIKPLLGLKALNDFVIKPLLGLKLFNDFVVKPLLGLKLFNDFVIKPLLGQKALNDFVIKPLLRLKALNDFVIKPLLVLKALNDFVVKPLLAAKALNDFVIKPLLGLKALNDFVIKPLLGLKALNDFVIKPLLGLKLFNDFVVKPLKNLLDWLITNIELLKLLSNPPVILSQLFVLGKPIFELNRDILAFVVFDAIGQLLFPIALALPVELINAFVLYALRLIVEPIITEELIGAYVPIIPTPLTIAQTIEIAFGKTLIDKEVAGLLFALTVSTILLPFVTAVDGMASLALLSTVAFPIIQSLINLAQNLKSIALILLAGNGWLLTNIELLQVFHNLPIVLTQVFVVGKLAAELVRDLIVFTTIDIAIQAAFPSLLAFVGNALFEVVADLATMLLEGLSGISVGTAITEVVLVIMRTFIDKELVGFVGASLISTVLLGIVVPLDLLSSIIINGNPLTHLI